MNQDLLGFVLNHLRRREVPWTDVAKASGVPYDTLKKIASGATPNPGVRHVQALAGYFYARLPDGANTPVNQAAATIEAVAQGVGHA